MNLFRQIITRRCFRPVTGASGAAIGGGAGRGKLAGFQTFSEAQAVAVKDEDPATITRKLRRAGLMEITSRRPRAVGPAFMKAATERGLNNG